MRTRLITLPELFALRSKRGPRRKYTRAARLSRAPEQPHAAELAYTRDILRLVRPVRDLVRALIFPELSEIAGRQDALYGHIGNRFRFVVEETKRLTERPKVLPVVEAQAARVDKFSRKQTTKQIGLDFSRDTQTQLRLAQFRESNVALIQSIPSQMLDQVEEVLLEGQSQGWTVKQLQDSIEERFDVSESRAALIARDQTLKANADLSSARMQDAGITEYVWTTAGDERVRPEHQRLDGTRHAWSLPPVVSEDGRREPPGRDFQCRCWADPVIPE